MTPRVFPRLYLASDAEAAGPYDAHDVLDSFRAGSLRWEHHAAIEGTDDWQPLGDILRAFFPGLVIAPRVADSPAPPVVQIPVYTAPPRQSFIGRLFDFVGASILIIGGAAMIILGIPLMAVLIGFILVPLGVFFVILGTVMLFKS